MGFEGPRAASSGGMEGVGHCVGGETGGHAGSYDSLSFGQVLSRQTPLCGSSYPSSNVHVTSTNLLLQPSAACSNGRYNVVIGFSPTGWTHQKEQIKGKMGRRVQKGTVVHYQV